MIESRALSVTGFEKGIAVLLFGWGVLDREPLPTVLDLVGEDAR